MSLIEKNKLPLLPLRDVVAFPETVMPILLGRKKSFLALCASQEIGSGEHILITTQKERDITDPNEDDLFVVGSIARILRTIKLPNQNAKIIVHIENRVNLSNIELNDKMFTANYEIYEDKKLEKDDLYDELIEQLVISCKEYIDANKKISFDFMSSIKEEKNLSKLSYLILSQMNLSILEKQTMLENIDLQDRVEKLISSLTHGAIQISIEHSLNDRVKKQIEKTQRDFYLNEQMKAIQKELDKDGGKSEYYDLEAKIKKLKLSEEAKEKANAELKKLKIMNQMSSEYGVVRNYLETMLSLPWGKVSKKNIDIDKAQNILDRDHYGLTKIKERVIEYLAVLNRTGKLKGSILCFIGPPGVGKTSLVKSIAEAVGRKYGKIALGGVRDEAEIRGHRKTYVGAMPGKIVNSLRKVKVDNPVLLLDEIDKLGSDFRGDPSSALLELLDPEQNSVFTDHYLEVEYDMSNIMYIATANSYKIPAPLLDRMEIINISGYVEDEKLKIARDHLIKKQISLNGLKASEIKITDNAILHLIRYYTHESGVRGLERQIAAIARKIVIKLQKDKNLKSVKVDADDIEELLGVKKYKFGLAENQDQIGITTGLAYTEQGGDLLQIEAVALEGDGKIKATGKLGDVMKESAEAAYSCFLSRTNEFGLKSSDYNKLDVHLHVPEGAIPKDGPSAGIAIYTTLVSLMTKNPVSRTVAMTGEITLRGKVLPIGGLKEKLLAAKRGGITTVIVPEDNMKDVKDIPSNIKDSLKIMPVSNVKQVIDIALVN